MNLPDPLGLCAGSRCGNADPSNSLIQATNQLHADLTVGIQSGTPAQTSAGGISLIPTSTLAQLEALAQNGQSNNNRNIQLAANTETPGNNQVQNAQIRSDVTILGLPRDQQKQLHHEISGQNYNYQEILQAAKDMFGK